MPHVFTLKDPESPSDHERNLSRERVDALLSYDPTTGLFRWKVGGRRRVAGGIAGTVRADGYTRISIDGVQYAAHRLAWFVTHGRWPCGIIDHDNRRRSDNRISNLRDVDHVGNANNKTPPLAPLADPRIRQRRHLVKGEYVTTYTAMVRVGAAWKRVSEHPTLLEAQTAATLAEQNPEQYRNARPY